MYLRPHRRKKGEEVYEYWPLVESVRTANGSRQRTVATRGKQPGLDDEARVGWEHIGEILDGRVHQPDSLQTAAMAPGREETPWGVMACILALARFCAPSPELHIAESWYAKTALQDTLGVAPERANVVFRYVPGAGPPETVPGPF